MVLLFLFFFQGRTDLRSQFFLFLSIKPRKKNKSEGEKGDMIYVFPTTVTGWGWKAAAGDYLLVYRFIR